jgi:hypothetical protein
MGRLLEIPRQKIIVNGFERAVKGLGAMSRQLSVVPLHHLVRAFFWKAGHCWPVERKTSTEGRLRHLMPNMRQERGKEGSQVTLKWVQRRQLGEAEGLLSAICL